MWQELDTLEPALGAMPTGIEGVKFTAPVARVKKDHCSAFVATGPATADGKIVFGHITMFGLTFGPHVNVWIDCKPTKGHRFAMQAFPGGVWSSQDYYQNDAGILLCETTINQTPFDSDGEPLTTRARKAIQYSESIDEVVKLLDREEQRPLHERMADRGHQDERDRDVRARHEEEQAVAEFERRVVRRREGNLLGLQQCQGPGGPARGEAGGPHASRAATAWRPSGRDKAWQAWFEKYNGKIDEAAAKEAFSSPSLALPHSLDAKFTTTGAGQGLGFARDSTARRPARRGIQRSGTSRTIPDIKPLVSHPWTVLTINPPPEMKLEPAPRAAASRRENC